MITLMIGNVAGLIAYMVAKDYGIDAVVAYDNKQLYREMGNKVYGSIKEVHTNSRILLSVHGREIVPDEILSKYRYSANVHPYFNKYKGKTPIKRAIIDNCITADVTSHEMTNKVDEGDIIFQEEKIVSSKTEQEIYIELYPLYAKVIKDTITYFHTNDQHYSNYLG